MKTFTFGETPVVDIVMALPHKYKMELNKTDMVHLLDVCKIISEHSIQQCSIEEERIIQDWATSFRSSILQTIGIEEV